VTPEAIATLLQPYADAGPNPAAAHPDWPNICSQLAQYLELILKWNARTNLTAIRTPEEIVQRHFGESLFAGAHIGSCQTLLDYGSGAGFPGVPIQLLRPDIAVTLAESQNKKASFLREVIRTLKLSTEVWSSRVETMASTRRFDVVAMRAVDNMEAAVREAAMRASGRILILGSSGGARGEILGQDFDLTTRVPLPGTTESFLAVFSRR
jgi:16S rRNA (guanine527-N7)-methyltransferase